MAEHPIQGLMQTAMENIKGMVDVNTIVGDPVNTPDGSVILPISKVAFGFAAGGSDYNVEAGAPTQLPRTGRITITAPFLLAAAAAVACPFGRLLSWSWVKKECTSCRSTIKPICLNVLLMRHRFYSIKSSRCFNQAAMPRTTPRLRLRTDGASKSLSFTAKGIFAVKISGFISFQPRLNSNRSLLEKLHFNGGGLGESTSTDVSIAKWTYL